MPQPQPQAANADVRVMAMRMFKCLLSCANGISYQGLLWDVRKVKYGQQFHTCAPHGRNGDGGNDGYHPADAHYFQSYAPIDPAEKVSVAATKLTRDFWKLLKKWAKHGGIKKFTFAYNDKYIGFSSEIELALQKLRAKYPNITFHQYDCRDLENDFASLTPTEWDRILNCPVPDPANFGILQYGVLAEVIQFLMAIPASQVNERLTLPPELDDKIGLVKLSDENAATVRNGARYAGEVTRYFSANAAFKLQELRNRVLEHYEVAKKTMAGATLQSTSVADAVFSAFRRSLFPHNATLATALAVDAIIGYFFEACDVFDPRVAKDAVGAAP